MSEWLAAAIPGEDEFPTAQLIGHLVRVAGLGGAIAGIYYLTQRKGRADAAPLVATLVLLTVLTGMVTRVIGDNVARAFSLAGALAIVRFRTAVDDTRDSAFVVAGVVIGMASGAGMTGVALAGLPVLAVVAVVLAVWARSGPASPPTGRLIVRVGVGTDPADALAPVLGQHLAQMHLVAAGTAKQGTALELTYQAVLRPGATVLGLVTAVTGASGVQGVDWATSRDGG